ncbi:unnamed protein product [Parnassius apollo]|uniref:(apollo) hypothetical protein n=1 Tax=Parnassius apollo TaxID=110799 RepID=A0A8S3X8U1_PARAO|nr:unnamed protein product [Parnassius apollo]
MRKEVGLMPSLEVMVERLPESVIAALEGPVVKQDFALLQSLPALNMTTVAMLLRRKIIKHSPMPLLEVAIERLPKHLMSAFVSQTNGRAVMPLSDITSPEALPTLKVSSAANVKKALPSLEVTLERLPEDLMAMLLAQRKVLSLVAKGKKQIGQRKKHTVSKKFCFVNVDSINF